MKTRTVHALFIILALGVIGCDHASKAVVEKEIRDQPIELISGTLELHYAQNHGVAFNSERLLPASLRKPLIYAAGGLALIALGVAWVRRYRQPSLEHLGYALIVGGAVGNLADRLARGYVVDFVHVQGWPIFNVADVAICIGAFVLLGCALRPKAQGA